MVSGRGKLLSLSFFSRKIISRISINFRCNKLCYPLHRINKVNVGIFRILETITRTLSDFIEFPPFFRASYFSIGNLSFQILSRKFNFKRADTILYLLADRLQNATPFEYHCRMIFGF
ncbi:hypothetical protein V6Z11_A12G085400 [Gossypium hirsutum]